MKRRATTMPTRNTRTAAVTSFRAAVAWTIQHVTTTRVRPSKVHVTSSLVWGALMKMPTTTIRRQHRTQGAHTVDAPTHLLAIMTRMPQMTMGHATMSLVWCSDASTRRLAISILMRPTAMDHVSMLRAPAACSPLHVITTPKPRCRRSAQIFHRVMGAQTLMLPILILQPRLMMSHVKFLAARL